MPSLQTALPPELANNVIRLYRECLRRSKYIGHQIENYARTFPGLMKLNTGGLSLGKLGLGGVGGVLNIVSRFQYLQQHNTQLLVNMIRQQFKRNKHETDPEKIQKLKDDAARGLINHILYEAERLSGRRASNNVSSEF